MPNNTLNTNQKLNVCDDSPMFLDTVELVIRLPYHMESTRYPFKSPSPTEPSVWKHEYSNGYKQHVFTRNKLFLLGGFDYKPAVKYRVRRIPYNSTILHELLVEFSIPKLLIGNNFVDVPKRGLNAVYSKLLDVITGIYHFEEVTPNMIEEATLKRMGCGSQVVFPNIESYNLAQERIGSARLNLRLDIERPQFSERSTGLNISCNSYQFVFYNKTEELKRYAKSKGKAKFETDNELMVEDEGLFKLITETDNVCMRFELRLNGKAKIDNALKHIGEPARMLTLQTALEHDIPRRLLQWQLEQIIKGLPRADLALASNEDILNHISKVENKPDNMAKLYGYAMMERLPDQRKLRHIITEGKKRSAWTSYLKKLNGLPKLLDQPDPIQPILDKVFGTHENSNDTTSAPIKRPTNIILVKLTISITIKYCTKNRPSFCSASYWVRRVNTRAPPSWLAVGEA